MSCFYSCGGKASNQSASENEVIQIDAPFVMADLEVPEFKRDIFNVEAYGAIKQDKDKTWEAFKSAFNTCSRNGGGVVLVPEGKYVLRMVYNSTVKSVMGVCRDQV